jgi:hypothetical protein
MGLPFGLSGSGSMFEKAVPMTNNPPIPRELLFLGYFFILLSREALLRL